MKAAAFIVLALFTDGLQAALSASLAMVFDTAAITAPAVGTGLGAVAGCVLGGIGGAIVGALGFGVGALPGAAAGCALVGGAGAFGGSVTGAAAAPIILTSGIILGFVISICLSTTLGAALVTMLVLNGMYYPKFMLPSGIAELIPGFDLIPTWTAMVILCLVQKSKEEAKASGSMLAPVAALASASPSFVQSSVQTLNSVEGAATRKPVDGIRAPANDNLSAAEQRYAA